MQKRTPHKLTIYRRHAATCPLEGQPNKLDGCECPLWVHGKVRGKFIRRSLDTRSLITATLKKEELLAGRGGDDNSTPGGGIALVSSAPKGDVTLEFAAKDFLASKGRKASGTKKIYARALGHFRRYAEAHSLALLRQIDTPQIRQYLGEYDREWARNTAQNRLVHLRVFFNYCLKTRRWITFSPTADRDLNYAKPKTKSAKRLPFTPQQITQILAAVEQMPAETRDRARALVLLLLYTGMRISDATFFEREFLTERHTADYYVIKTRRPISLPPEVQKPALDALKALPASRVYFFQPDRDDDYREAREGLREEREFSPLMPDYEARVREATALVVKVLALAGIEGACHRFRDTFAINLLVSGVDIFTVSQMLGHSGVRITQEHYLKLIPGYRERMSQSTRSLAYAFPTRVA